MIDQLENKLLFLIENAVYSSFRAVIGVVDQFSRLKSQVVIDWFIS
jgi:hypothetical protein